jgi:hypothetical protein
VLLAVIFSFGSASDSRMGKELWDSQNNSAVFSRISAKKPSETGKWKLNRGDQGVFPVILQISLQLFADV